jgi:hypothetical protein
MHQIKKPLEEILDVEGQNRYDFRAETPKGQGRKFL